MLQPQYDFNKGNDSIRALNGIHDVHGRFISSANRFWWAYRIAEFFGQDPQVIKNWDSDEIMEALAYIGMREKKAPNVAK